MRPGLVLALAAGLVTALLARPARADGGRVCAAGDAGALRAAVVVAPSPLRVGQAEIGVWVQDARDGSVRAASQVALRVRAPQPEAATAPGAGAHAGHAMPGRHDAGAVEILLPPAADGAPLRTTTRSLPAAGPLSLAVDVRDGADALRLECTLEVAPPISVLREHALAWAFPLAVVAGYVWRARLQARRRAARGASPADPWWRDAAPVSPPPRSSR